MKKVGQITWWRNNYGSILQAIALQNKINELGDFDCEIICQYGKKVTSFNNLKDKLKNDGFFITMKKIFGRYILPKVRKRVKRMEDFVNQNLQISDIEYSDANIKESNEKYDVFVCGSDQIWNPGLVALNSIYWLGFVENNKTKFSYAPSNGITSYSKKDWNQINNNLKTFSSISCREKTGTNAINEVLGNDKCITVLDPTMLFSPSFWDKYISKTKLIKEDYVFTYLLRGTKEQRKAIVEFAHRNNLIVVTIPFLDAENINFYDFKFGDKKIWNADPGDFLALIKNAKYVFTDSYHSTIFSTLYHKNVIIFPKIGINQQSRLQNFQKDILKCDRTISKYNDLDKSIKELDEINWDSVDKIITKERKKSIEFLKSSLLDE